MAESKKIIKNTPIADVAHPGKSAPADNSRSIVINRPIMQDPMMADDKKTAGETTPAAKPNREATIQPLASSLVPADADESAAPPDTPDKPAVAAEPQEPPEPAKPEAPAETPRQPEKPSEPRGDEPSPAAEDKAKELDLEAEQAELVKHEAEIQKIIDSKKYYLTINSVEKRRSARFVALGIVLALVLIVAWIDVALDASLIHLGSLKAATHLFSS